MLRNLLSTFARKRDVQSRPAGTIPAGTRVYAVGDIHGRLDLLDDLLRRMESDDAARGAADTIVIFLGDLIDRGPDSAQVVQRLLELGARTEKVRFLLGNHEEVFLKSLAGEQKALPFFLRIGGKETVLSYGISQSEYEQSDYPELLALLRERVPQAHLDFLSAFEDMIVIGDYVFVHAGIRPGVPLEAQKPETLRWIREDFLNSAEPCEKIVVHGHSISEEVEERGRRIGLDTGAYFSGRLTAMGFEGAERWVLQTGDVA
ncbi:serine/threonine protein phosphatase [Sphingomonas koreensis]|jgi:serine/threonine protein phosphatase 1|uniref:Serine/threonine protein phosphatase n=1 Tax=Sphingomonas koreensis TaxID=93064 RepID=A0A1L6JFH9_9SPHN|nr:serine/threonine protein phosphatase [Sphingomonas koreensis]RSU20465.1 serine/threonine protein phosphatase [Sphingomonas koreensis]RSU28839.1 serine/threonine protein phosphatase [Sphingomonas koreensis]RSU29647.1 serine/threonine protein phosphatase [Sphingomonas koreensis]RSU36443.1 serine/threonine protein phosphatase [Sphingomonas koreensis]